ncbi:MAG: GspH/FimT family pseudopilin [Candidatus Thiodiazotropha sp. (ex Epidulcina cf. delphinae)]|nr:GspH/FimT family pseudopilin [Candidatus Thiodiazotropha sp. (ex Epidulcina cf. delphinae)]
MYRKKGLTLIELIVAISIGAILVTIGIPSFIGMAQRNSVSTTGRELLGALYFARSQATEDETATTLTPLANGWRVDADIVNAGAVNHLIHTVDNVNITMTGDPVTYNPRGRATVPAGESIDISYDGELQSRVCLSLSGRPSTKPVSDGACP